MRLTLRMVVRVIMATIFLFWVGFMVNSHAPFTGERILYFTVGRPHGVIGFWPNQDAESDSRYFDVLTTVLYDSGQIMLYSDKRPEGEWVVGVRVPPSIWHYHTETLVFEQWPDGHWVASAALPLRGATRVAEKYTFVMRRTDGVGTATPLPMTKFELRLQREPIFATIHRYWFGR